MWLSLQSRATVHNKSNKPNNNNRWSWNHVIPTNRPMKTNDSQKTTNHRPVSDVAEQGEQDAGDGDSRANVSSQHYQLLRGCWSWYQRWVGSRGVGFHRCCVKIHSSDKNMNKTKHKVINIKYIKSYESCCSTNKRFKVGSEFPKPI